MIQWNNIPTYMQTGVFYNPVQTPLAPQQPIFGFGYPTFGTLTTGAYNLPAYTPTPQGISSWSNPFSSWFNFSMPSFTMPTFNFSNLWSGVTTRISNLYDSTKRTASSVVTTITNFASRMINTAKKYLGFNEKDGSYKKFTSGRTEAWCADFATYVARESGANIPHFSGVSQILEWGRSNGKFSTQAKVGDIIIFKGRNKNGKQVSHTGIVTRIENGKVYTIEGNTSNKVGERSYALNDSKITGYVSVA